MSLPSSFKQFEELSEKRQTSQIDFLKHVLLMASGLLGILVALHSKVSTTIQSRISFIVSIGSLAFGIIMATIALYSHLHTLKRLTLLWKEEILKQLRNEATSAGPVVINPFKIFGLCETLGYISFVISILSLAAYAIFME